MRTHHQGVPVDNAWDANECVSNFHGSPHRWCGEEAKAYRKRSGYDLSEPSATPTAEKRSARSVLHVRTLLSTSAKARSKRSGGVWADTTTHSYPLSWLPVSDSATAVARCCFLLPLPCCGRTLSCSVRGSRGDFAAASLKGDERLEALKAKVGIALCTQGSCGLGIRPSDVI